MISTFEVRIFMSFCNYVKNCSGHWRSLQPFCTCGCSLFENPWSIPYHSTKFLGSLHCQSTETMLICCHYQYLTLEYLHQELQIMQTDGVMIMTTKKKKRLLKHLCMSLLCFYMYMFIFIYLNSEDRVQSQATIAPAILLLNQRTGHNKIDQIKTSIGETQTKCNHILILYLLDSEVFAAA